MNRESMAVEATIGKGGLGIVEKVWLPNGSEPVALKRLHPDSLVGRQRNRNRQRFRNEVRILRERLNHPNIITVLDADLESDEPWFLMPMADESLDDTVPPGGLPEDRVQAIFFPILDAIEHAHDRGVVHRDLKPQNVLIFRGCPVVADFGLGKQLDRESMALTTVGALGGTIAYVAPEQWMQNAVMDHRADIYALGSLLAFLVTGQDPLPAARTPVPAEYQRIIARCRHFDPAQRFSSVRKLRESLTEQWKPDADAIGAVGRANRLLSKVTMTTEDRRRLLDLYLENPTDFDLFSATLPAWPNSLASEIAAESPDDLIEVVRSLRAHLPRGFPFAYLDDLARFLRRTFEASDDAVLREVSITVLLTIGREFDEIDMGKTFVVLAKGARARHDQLLFRDVLNSNPKEAMWAGNYVNDSVEVPVLIRESIAGAEERLRQHEALDEERQKREFVMRNPNWTIELVRLLRSDEDGWGWGTTFNAIARGGDGENRVIVYEEAGASAEDAITSVERKVRSGMSRQQSTDG